MKKIQVQIRLPIDVLRRLKRVAKLADVTPSQVYCVLLACNVVSGDAANGGNSKDK